MRSSSEIGPAGELLKRAQAGDGGAFAALAAPTLPLLLRVAIRFTKSREDAEEIVQESLLSAARHLAAYRGEAAFSTWLVRITMNHALMAARRKRPETVPLETLPIQSCRICAIWREEAPTPEQVYLSEEAIRKIYGLIGRMRPAYRVVLTLKAKDQSHAEIAERLELPVRTVRLRLHRARRELKRLLENGERAA